MPTLRFAMRRKRWRAERQMSHADPAKASGVSRAQIAELEFGHQDPTLGTMRKLAQGLTVSAADLVESGTTRTRKGVR